MIAREQMWEPADQLPVPTAPFLQHLRALQRRRHEPIVCMVKRGAEAYAVYYDLPQYWPFWQVVENLDVPLYLHPRNPLPSQATIYEGHPWLLGRSEADRLKIGRTNATNLFRLNARGSDRSSSGACAEKTGVKRSTC